MINRKAIGYITANYSSTYGSVLLKDRPIASVPFLGRYRLIDFPLSNMMNAGIKTVGVVMPGNYRSLIDHVGSGKDWGLDRKKGGLFMVPGNAYGTTKGGMRFLLRDIISNKTLFQRSDKPYVVMMGTNIIFNMDLLELTRRNLLFIAHAVLMLNSTFQHVGQNFHIFMRVSAEALPCFNHVVVNHAQRGEAHKVRIVIVGKRESMPGVQPAMICMTTFICFA